MKVAVHLGNGVRSLDTNQFHPVFKRRFSSRDRKVTKKNGKLWICSRESRLRK